MTGMSASFSELSIDKSNWEPTALGDIAEEVSKRVSNPALSEYERFVGLEHFVSGDLKIRKWSSTEKVSSSAKAFEKGDILLARRNAYLRRASLVEFDGCCSGDAFVIREKQNKVVPGFLAFLVNSDRVWSYAISNAAGTMSKRVKWRDLASYEFLLPPREKQIELLKLLWATGEVIDKNQKLNQNIERLMYVYLNKAFRYGAFLDQETKQSSFGEIPSNWSLQSLGSLGDFKNGINKDKSKFGYGKPFVNLMDVFGYKELFLKDFDLVDVTQKELEAFDVRKGDVLFVRSSVKPSGVGLTTLVQDSLPNTVYSGFIIRFRSHSTHLTHTFKKYCFYEKRFRVSLCSRSTISANTNINQESLKILEIPIPPLEEQHEFNSRMNHYENLLNMSEKSIETSKKMLKSLINQVF